MSTIIAISGPSATGKTTIIEELKTRPEFKNAIFIDDLFETVWTYLIENDYFSEYDDINKDTEFLCVYLIKLIEKYEYYIKKYRFKEKLVVLDCCWVDLLVYAVNNMWSTHIVKEVQDYILSKLSKFDEELDRIYITKYDEERKSTLKHRMPFKRSNIKNNRDLELSYYDLYSHFKNATKLKQSDPVEISSFIIEDMKDLGYLR